MTSYQFIRKVSYSDSKEGDSDSITLKWHVWHDISHCCRYIQVFVQDGNDVMEIHLAAVYGIMKGRPRLSVNVLNQLNLYQPLSRTFQK